MYLIRSTVRSQSYSSLLPRRWYQPTLRRPWRPREASFFWETVSQSQIATRVTSTSTSNMWTFKYVVEGWLMPSVSLFGLLGNFVSLHILHHKEVKLKKDYVDVLCMLATFDNLLLISTFLLFSLPTLSENYLTEVSSVKYLYLYLFCNFGWWY